MNPPTFQTGQTTDLPLSSVVEGDQYREATVVDDDRFTEAAQKAMDTVPVSRRELARRAGVSHWTLNAVASGQLPASAATVLGLTEAVLSLSADMSRAREALEPVARVAKRQLEREDDDG